MVSVTCLIALGVDLEPCSTGLTGFLNLVNQVKPASLVNVNSVLKTSFLIIWHSREGEGLEREWNKRDVYEIDEQVV